MSTPTSPWTVSGDPTWAITTYRVAAGTYSSYCAGSAIAAPGPYVNNMSAWRIAGPFNLSTVSSATFLYNAYVATEINAAVENIGARRLHTVMTTLLEDVLYELPERGTEPVKIDAKVVRDRLKAIAEDEDLRKYIL